MTKIDIFSGFLGAGKTTLIKKMIAESYKGQKLVLIENEFGEIGIDGGFLQDSGINITEMNSGCICCSLVGDFGKALKKVIAEYHPDRILIEPSGVGKLSDVIAAVSKVTNDDVTLGYTVAVADAGKVKVYMKNFGEFYNNQIETASTIILSRTDSIPQSKLDTAVAMLREHNSVATIVTTPWGELTGEQLIKALEGKASVAAELAKMEIERLAEEDEEEEHHCCHHHHDEDKVITLEQDILRRNNLLAERNRGYFEAKEIFCLNLMSSPGSGKTTLLEETVRRLKGKLPLYVIEGDQQTSNDADRIAALDIPVFQVNTGTGCHLEADMVNHAVKHLAPTDHSILFIENVGNLVCPAMFDLGEAKKVVIVSTTEGDDKPLKYPHIFAEADVCVINKTDLAPYLNTDIETLKSNALKVNHHLQVFEVSATKGDGMDAWCDWLCSECAKCK